MQPNKVIQNYIVTHLLGSGGMGEVWAGKHLYMDRKVAIKSLHPSLVSNPEIRARFKNEAVTMSQLDHPNIVRLYDYIEEADGVYLVMEYVDGDALDEYILRKTGPIPEDLALHLFGQILEGMYYAHVRGVIHRDIKPSNFMVTRDRRVKILDFGIAKLLEATGRQHTKTGSRIGTVLYMSPEQVRGQTLDIRSDIYSLGVTLFQMVTGQSPYPSQATEFEVYQRIVNEPLPPARTLYPAVSEKVQAVIDTATAKRPEARFQDCRAFLEAVVHVPAVQVVQQEAQPYAWMASPPPQKKRRRFLKLFIFMGIVAGLAVGGYFWGWPFLEGAITEPKEVVREFLEALENGDRAGAEKWVSSDCDTDIDRFFRLQKVPTHRKVYIGESRVVGARAEVTYSYGGENDSYALDLIHEGLRWVVHCY